jgi:hypothetical protein
MITCCRNGERSFSARKEVKSRVRNAMSVDGVYTPESGDEQAVGTRRAFLVRRDLSGAAAPEESSVLPSRKRRLSRQLGDARPTAKARRKDRRHPLQPMRKRPDVRTKKDGDHTGHIVGKHDDRRDLRKQ